jgi:hypothetical protein
MVGIIPLSSTHFLPQVRSQNTAGGVIFPMGLTRSYLPVAICLPLFLIAVYLIAL